MATFQNSHTQNSHTEMGCNPVTTLNGVTKASENPIHPNITYLLQCTYHPVYVRSWFGLFFEHVYKGGRFWVLLNHVCVYGAWKKLCDVLGVITRTALRVWFTPWEVLIAIIWSGLHSFGDQTLIENLGLSWKQPWWNITLQGHAGHTHNILPFTLAQQSMM